MSKLYWTVTFGMEENLAKEHDYDIDDDRALSMLRHTMPWTQNWHDELSAKVVSSPRNDLEWIEWPTHAGLWLAKKPDGERTVVCYEPTEDGEVNSFPIQFIGSDNILDERECRRDGYLFRELPAELWE